MVYGMLFAVKGDGRNALKHLKNSLKYLQEGGIPFFLPFVFYYLGWGHYYLGQLETARNHIQRGLEIQKEVGVSPISPFLYSLLSMIHLDLGEFEGAQSCAEKALDLAQKSTQKYAKAYGCCCLGRILGKKEPTQMDKAEEYIQKGMKIFTELKMKAFVPWSYLLLGDLYADMGQREKALENLKKAEEMFKEMEYYIIKTQEVIARL